MKDIFTYPLNPGTNYIDPVYSGYPDSGFWRRVTEFKDGDYRAWNSPAPTESVSGIMRAMSKYYQRYQESWGENTFYRFYKDPMIEAVMRTEAGIGVKDISIERVVDVNGTHFVLLVETDEAHPWVSGSRLYMSSFVTPELTGLTAYVEVIDSTTVRLWSNSELSNGYFNDLVWTPYDTGKYGGGLVTRVHRDGDRSLIRFNSAPPWGDQETVQLASLFTDPLDTGTSNALNTPYYLQKLSDFTFAVYTDAARTTGATLNEHYVTTGTRNFTSGATAQTFSLGYELWGDYGITDLAGVQTEGNGWMRITATVNSGTFTGSVDCPNTIGTAKSYTQTFYWQYYTGARVGIFDERGSSIPGDFELGPNSDVDITIEVINPARIVEGYGKWLVDDTTDASGVMTDDPDVDYEIDYYRVYSYGDLTYTYLDSAGDTQNGARFLPLYTLPGENSDTPLQSGEFMPLDSMIQLDSSGRLSGFDLTERGTFKGPQPRRIIIQSRDNLYVAPGITPAQQQDIWDTADEWTDTGFDGSKEWPRHVSPASARMEYRQPSSVTRSQAGTKYVRNSGYTRWSLEVNYPPMREESFRQFHTVAQQARGQYIPFYFVNRDSQNQPLLFNYRDASNNITAPRVRTATAPGDTLLLLEGFSSGDSGAATAGELIIGGGTNGNIRTVVNTVDANQYGEARIRLAYPMRFGLFAGSQIYFNPYHFVVTLAESGFEYTVDTAGFYYLTVKFDFDEFK